MRHNRFNPSRDEARRARERARDLDPTDARGAFLLLGDALRRRSLPDYGTETAVNQILDRLELPSHERIALLLEALGVRHRRNEQRGRTEISFSANGYDVHYFDELRESDCSSTFDDQAATGWSVLCEIGSSGFQGGFVVLSEDGEDVAFHEDRSVVRLALDFLLRPERLRYDFAQQGGANLYWFRRLLGVAVENGLECGDGSSVEARRTSGQGFRGYWLREEIERLPSEFEPETRTTPLIPQGLHHLRWGWSDPDVIEFPLRPNTANVFWDTHYTPEGFVDEGLKALGRMQLADERATSPDEFVERLAQVLGVHVGNRRPDWFPTTLTDLDRKLRSVATIKRSSEAWWGFKKSLATYLLNEELLNVLHGRFTALELAYDAPSWITAGKVALVFHDTPSPTSVQSLRSGPGGFHPRGSRRHLASDREGANKPDGILRASLVSVESEDEAEERGARERMVNATTIVGTYQTPGELVRDAFASVRREGRA